jgi:low temperature requirement protein LtrA
MTSRAGELLRRPGALQQATFLELSFDLVFLLAITQVSQGLIQRLTWSGAFQALVLLLAVWWVWSYTAWTTDSYDPQQRAIQRLVIAAMFGTFVMAVALPDAFGKRGLVFAGVYVAIHIGRHLFLVRALRGHELRARTARILFWFGVSAVPWIVGALLHRTAREALWTLAVAVDYAAVILRYPRPGPGRRSTSAWAIVAEHRPRVGAIRR